MRHTSLRYGDGMTGNIRNSLGLLVVALIATLIGLFLTRMEALQDLGAIFILGAIVVGLFALVRIAMDLLKSPERD
jgi:uncharacterized membrane protein